MLGLPEFGDAHFDKDVNVYLIIDLMRSILKHTNKNSSIEKYGSSIL